MNRRRGQPAASASSGRESSRNQEKRGRLGSQNPLWQVSIKVSREAEEAVTELLSDTLGQPVFSYTDIESDRVTVAVLFTSRQGWSAAARQRVQARLRFIKQCGLSVGSGKVSFSKLAPRDWAHAWKRHFKPMVIGSALVIRPSWARFPARRGQRVVVLDPGLSFGTGQHPTTRFCLRQLVACRPSGDRKSLLDLGTGSGILAIAAAKLGFSSLKGLDLDPESVAVARANARRNGVERKIEFCRADVSRLPLRPSERYSIICANLLTPLLLSQRRRITRQLQRHGRLVLAGILKKEFRQVQAAFEQAGMTLADKRIEGEWCSGSFTN